MQCCICETTDAPHWITEKVNNIVETNTKGLLTVKNATQTFIYCPTCYEEEATNAI